MTNQKIFLKVLITVLVLVGVSENTFSQANLQNFPHYPAKWILKLSTPDSLGCQKSFIRYHAKGDTTIASKRYYKVYRQTSKDSNGFQDSRDTLRLLFRNGTLDSFQVFMRFVDSINEYGQNEFIISHLRGYFPKDSISGYPRDTFFMPLALSKKKYQFARLYSFAQGIVGVKRCVFTSKTKQLNVRMYGFVSLNHSSSSTCIKYNSNMYGGLGDQEHSWFSADIDSMALIDTYTNNCRCKNKSATLFSFEGYIKNEQTGISDWYSADMKCISRILIPESIDVANSNSLQIKISPNPFSISFKVQHSESINSLKLIDVAGKVFLDEKYNSVDLEKTIKLESLQPGIYFLIVNGEYSKKVMRY